MTNRWLSLSVMVLVCLGCSGAPRMTAAPEAADVVEPMVVFTALKKVTPAQWRAFEALPLRHLYRAALAVATDAPVNIGGTILAQRRARLIALSEVIEALDGQFASYGDYLRANQMTIDPSTIPTTGMEAALAGFANAIKAYEQGLEAAHGPSLGLISCDSSGKFAAAMLGHTANSADAVSGNFQKFVVDRVNMQALPSAEHWFPGIPVLSDVAGIGTNLIMAALQGTVYGGAYTANYLAGCSNPGGSVQPAPQPPAPAAPAAPKAVSSCPTGGLQVGSTDATAGGCIESD